MLCLFLCLVGGKRKWIIMRNKKAHWFIKNSHWIFWVALVPAVVLGNIAFTKAQSWFRFGYQSRNLWTFLMILIALVLNIVFLGFIIYLHDSNDGNVKKRLSLFDFFIRKWHMEE